MSVCLFSLQRMEKRFTMIKYIIRRVLLIIPIILGVILIVFSINYFSDGSPAMTILGANATMEEVEALEHELGLDRPYFVQLGEYIWNIVTKFDFGTSYFYNRPVTEMIGSGFSITARLALMGVALSVVVGIPLGAIAAVKQYSAFDYGSTFLAIILAALPGYWVALMLILFFSVRLGVLPVSGLSSWKGWILPVISGGLSAIATIARMTRSSLLEVIRQDYIRTARAKGLPERKVIMHHAMRNGMIPVVTVIGNIIGMSMAGTIITETIFNIPGLGLVMYKAVTAQDRMTIQGCAILCAIIVAVMNLITDLAYAAIDPRIKSQYVSAAKKARRTRA